MNILVVAHYQGDGSPSASFIHNQVKAYHSLGHEVRVLSPVAIGKTNYASQDRIRTKQRQIDGIWYTHLRYFTLSRYGAKHFNAHSAIGAIRGHWKQIFGDFRPDVIHAHTLGFDSEIGAFLKKKLDCPLVVTTHGSDAAGPLERGEGEFLRTACNKADAVVAVSTALREKVRGCGTTTRLEAIVNGFVLRERLPDMVRKPFRMIQVCNLILLKRVDVTVRAFATLQNRYPQMELTVIGQGPQRAALEALCAQLSVADKVHFLGQLPNDAVFKELSKSAFFVMVSKPEGFGIAYLEAMAAGCVTIGTEGEGIADVIVSGENGYLVSADEPDAIVQVIEACLADPQKAGSVALAGQTTARELTWNKNARKYLELFDKLINKEPSQ